MLRYLIPDGRTHRLAPLVAGMRQYTTLVANETTAEDEVVDLLQEAAQAYDPDEAVCFGDNDCHEKRCSN